MAPDERSDEPTPLVLKAERPPLLRRTSRCAISVVFCLPCMLISALRMSESTLPTSMASASASLLSPDTARLCRRRLCCAPLRIPGVPTCRSTTMVSNFFRESSYFFCNFAICLSIFFLALSEMFGLFLISRNVSRVCSIPSKSKSRNLSAISKTRGTS